MSLRPSLAAGEQDPEHASEELELNQSGGQGEEHAEHDQERDQRPTPGTVPNGVEDRIQEVHLSLPLPGPDS
jgi:hypothetical protein